MLAMTRLQHKDGRHWENESGPQTTTFVRTLTCISAVLVNLLRFMCYAVGANAHLHPLHGRLLTAPASLLVAVGVRRLDGGDCEVEAKAGVSGVVNQSNRASVILDTTALKGRRRAVNVQNQNATSSTEEARKNLGKWAWVVSTRKREIPGCLWKREANERRTIERLLWR